MTAAAGRVVGAAIPRHDLVVLAGGTGRRLDGADKAELVVGGERLLDRVLATGPRAGRRVVVGPVRPTVVPVSWCREEPTGGGPVAALAAALAEVEAPVVVVLAVDLALVDAAVVDRLLVAVAGRDGAMAVDESGRDQPLLAAYGVAELARAITALDRPAGASMHTVTAGLDLARVAVGSAALDCDTPADVVRAERWLRGSAAGRPDTSTAG